MEFGNHLWWLIACLSCILTGHYLLRIIGHILLCRKAVRLLLVAASVFGAINLVPVVYSLLSLIPGIPL